jgi:peptidoglycan/LPS O-acetylase OafA/YrhL
MFVVVPLIRPSEAHTVFDRSSPWWAYPLYLQNFLVPIPANATGPLGVTWSLAIEEQFYLVWPLIVRSCSNLLLRRIALSVILVSPVLRLFMASQGVNLYSNTFSRLDGLMAGALLATIVRSADFVPSRFVGKAWAVLFTAAPLAFLTEAFHARWIVFSMSAAASAALVYLSLYSEDKWLQDVLKVRFIVYSGTISYGLYLLHKIPFDVARSFELDKYPIVAAPILLAACYGMAALSWNLFEKPFLKLKRFFESKPPRMGDADRQLVVEESGR